jgi:hypothetical protein
VSRDRRKFKKAQTLGENKTLKRGIMFRDMVIGAQSKELVYVMYARIWEAIFQAAVLKCMEKFAGQLYTETTPQRRQRKRHCAAITEEDRTNDHTDTTDRVTQRRQAGKRGA